MCYKLLVYQNYLGNKKESRKRNDIVKFFCVVGLQDVYNANSTRSYAKIEQSPKLYIGNQLITVDRFKNLPNASAIG